MLDASEIRTDAELEALISSLGFSSKPIALSRRRFFAVPEVLCREIVPGESSTESPVMLTIDRNEWGKTLFGVWYFDHEDWNGWEQWDYLPAETEEVTLQIMILAAGSRFEIRKRHEALRRAGAVAHSLIEELGRFVAEHNLGWVASGHLSIVSPRYRGRELHPYGVFLMKDRLDRDPGWKIQIPPDLIIDSIRPGPGAHSDLQSALIKEYSDIGVRLQWILDQENREILTYTPSMERRRLALGDTLRGQFELEGFQVEVSSLMETEYPEVSGYPIIRVRPQG